MKSVFGELTWHFTDRGQLTAGFRHFEQDFEDTQYLGAVCLRPDRCRRRRTPPSASKTTCRRSTRIVRVCGQSRRVCGYGRRAFLSRLAPMRCRWSVRSPIIRSSSPIVPTPPLRVTVYQGHFSNGLSYTLAAFNIIWENPQIGGTTPTTNFAVWNAKEADVQGHRARYQLARLPLGRPEPHAEQCLRRASALQGLSDRTRPSATS